MSFPFDNPCITPTHKDKPPERLEEESRNVRDHCHNYSTITLHLVGKNMWAFNKSIIRSGRHLCLGRESSRSRRFMIQRNIEPLMFSMPCHLSLPTINPNGASLSYVPILCDYVRFVMTAKLFNWCTRKWPQCSVPTPSADTDGKIHGIQRFIIELYRFMWCRRPVP